ncbi:epoxide hydrolase family protein [Sphingobium aromaticiconvertens]|uniref:epoxide hydrolase family protein n=1 Tax=Sphingobium aromaticiconvertens TaxID=365341 RepID=UPI00301760CA
MEQFEIHVPDSVLDDLRRRIGDMRWPPSAEGLGWGYGFEQGYLRALAESWRTDFDWRAVERQINGFTHYRAVVDEVPIHFIREPGRGPAPIPLILTHGWPWTFWDMQKVIRPLADPAAYGGDPADAFDVIVPSLPGFTFSTPLPRVGINSVVTADLWRKLMTDVLGYPRFAAAGADWGARVTGQLGHKHADALYGIHTVNTTPLDLFNAERYWDITGYLVPYDTPPEIRARILPGLSRIVSHVAVQTVEPQTLAYAMHDSPVGMLAWLMQRRRDWGETGGDIESAFPREHLLATATLYWATESFASAARFYAEAIHHRWRPSHDRKPVIQAPAGITFLGGENPPGIDTPAQRIALFKASTAIDNYDLHYVNAHPHGGHFAHYENPEACITDIRATFRDLRHR